MPRASHRLPLLASLIGALGVLAGGAVAQQAPFANPPPEDPAREAEEALLASVQRTEGSQDAVATANALRNLASFYHTQARYAEARTLHERALALRETTLGRDHADVLQSLTDLALLDIAEGNAATATERYERVLRAQRKQ
jgi:tetratricopeptide (TPR) repeat protein